MTADGERLKRIRWVGSRIEPLEPIPPGDRDAAWRFAGDMAKELAFLVPTHTSIEKVADEYARHFLLDWCLWPSSDSRPAAERRDEALKWLHHMIACDGDDTPSSPTCRRALGNIIFWLVGVNDGIPPALREWTRKRAGEQTSAPQAGLGKGNSPECKIAKEQETRAVGMIVKTMKEHPALKGVITVTRNDASPPVSICDAVAEALTDAGHEVKRRGVRGAWDRYRKLPKTLKTLD